MGIKLNIEPATLAASLALACHLVFATPFPQGDIALTTGSDGRQVYVNAGEFIDPEPGLTSAALGRAPADLKQLASRTARDFQVDPKLVDAIIQVESGYNIRARSPKGALGLMQLLPATASRYGVKDAFDPADNLRGGVSYLGHLLRRFQGDVRLSLAAYNAGEGAVLGERGVPPFTETRDYVRKIAALYPAPSSAPDSSKLADVEPASSSRPAADPAQHEDNAASRAPIYRYVDAEGVIHFAQ